MARTTPGTGIPVPESPDPRTITADLWASFSKVGQLITQTSGESSAALVTAEQAETAASQALARALAIEEPVHVGPDEPTDGEALWVDTDEDAPPTPVSVSSEDITDATDVGRAVLTAPLSVDARNALSIFTGTRALLDEGTDTAERTWDAKELSEYVTSKAGGYYHGDLPSGTDMNNVRPPSFATGLWGVPKNSLATTIANWPPQLADRGGLVEVLWASNGITVQRVTGYGSNAVTVQRSSNSVTQGTYTSWVQTSPVDLSGYATEQYVDDAVAGGGGGGGIEAYAPHAIREAQFMQAMGGPIDTEGKAAVAFRMDHGFKNFAEKLLPLFRARSIVPSMVYNPRNWGRAENDGYTATDLNAWVAAGEVEVWNHGADHSDVSSDVDLFDQIVNSLAEIEAEVPAAAGKVWGFAPPGVNSTTGYGGYGSGSTPEKWDTTAGRLILKHHAVTAAYLPGTGTRPLDGQIRQGQSHYTLDNYSVAEIKSRIDTGITRGHGVQLMLHPSLVDTAGYPTTADVEEILDYVVAKRDAGQLVTLSPYQMLVADSTRPPANGGVYDSGEIDITAAFSPISGGAYLSRFGPMVTMHLSDLVVSDTAHSFIQWPDVIPPGYRPARHVDFGLTARNTAEYDSMYSGYVRSDGLVTIYKIEPGEAQRAAVTWRTPDPEPV